MVGGGELSLAADAGSREPEVGGAEHQLAADDGSWETAGADSIICSPR